MSDQMIGSARQMSSHARRAPETVLLPVKLLPELRRRFRLAAVSRDMTYAQLIEHWLDQDEAPVNRARRQQAHPLHRPDPPRRSA